jgi:hypothetical protein
MNAAREPKLSMALFPDSRCSLACPMPVVGTLLVASILLLDLFTRLGNAR